MLGYTSVFHSYLKCCIVYVVVAIRPSLPGTRLSLPEIVQHRVSAPRMNSMAVDGEVAAVALGAAEVEARFAEAAVVSAMRTTRARRAC